MGRETDRPWKMFPWTLLFGVSPDHVLSFVTHLQHFLRGHGLSAEQEIGRVPRKGAALPWWALALSRGSVS